MRRFFSNQGVGRRLAAGFALVGVLLVVVSALGITSARSASSSLRDVDTSAATTRQAMQLKFRAADLNGWQTAYAFDIVNGTRGATDDTAPSRKAFLASVASFRDEASVIDDAALTDEERATLASALNKLDEFMALDVKIIAAYRAGDGASAAQATSWVLNEEIAIFTDIAAAIDRFVAQVGADADATVASAASSGSRSQTLISVGALVALALAALLAKVITGSITGPLDRLRERLAEIADGDGDLTQRLDESRRDELGQVGAAFNRFVAKIAAAIRQIADHAVVIASASEELSAVSRQMAGTADHTAHQAVAASATAEEVSANVQTVAAATEEMNAAIAEIARGATDASRVAARAMELADAAQATIARLGASSDQIDDVARLIGGIAEQTNLLALNATIEAARAGEAGKGFGVVATEVKDLATRSAGATADISTQIARIHTDVRDAVESMSAIASVVDQINETFAAIATAVEEQTATTGEISRNLVQVSTGSETIAAGITDVSRSAAESTQGASDTEHAAVELSALAADLQQLVGQFRF